MSAPPKDALRTHWEAEPCGSTLTEAPPGSKRFFDEVEAERYRREPFIPGFAEFEHWRGKRVLEVGVGLGTDFVRFARAGAVLTGVDLTKAAVELVRRRLELEGLEAHVEVADAESLPFEDESFDLVYSWGVLHHTHDPARAAEEVRRVLAPGAEARVMLYSRRSWVAFGLWVRHALARGRPWRTLEDVVAHHMESPGTRAFTAAEVDELFARFSSVRQVRFVTPYDRRVGGPMARVSTKLGWFTGITARR